MSIVFNLDRINDNEHTAADLNRMGSRLLFFNETLSMSWPNGVFKNHVSSDFVVCRGRGDDRVIRFAPTYIFCGGINDPPSWETTPKWSGENRLLPIYLPNKFFDEEDIVSSPGRFPRTTRWRQLWPPLTLL